jgi:hypothetical protein
MMHWDLLSGSSDQAFRGWAWAREKGSAQTGIFSEAQGLVRPWHFAAFAAACRFQAAYFDPGAI